jgi:hypothetical protein
MVFPPRPLLIAIVGNSVASVVPEESGKFRHGFFYPAGFSHGLPIFVKLATELTYPDD